MTGMLYEDGTTGARRRRTALPAYMLLTGDVTPGPYGVHPAHGVVLYFEVGVCLDCDGLL